MDCSNIAKIFFSRFSGKTLLPALLAAPFLFTSPVMAVDQVIQSGDHHPINADGQGNNYTSSYVTTGGASNTITTAKTALIQLFPAAILRRLKTKPFNTLIAREKS